MIAVLAAGCLTLALYLVIRYVRRPLPGEEGERRTGFDPREEAGERRARVRPEDQAMSEAEALAILGLDHGADEEAIRAAYRRIIARVHPDAGGSDKLASLAEASRQRLLGRKGSQ
jgi:hypothetical protein